VDSIEHGSLLDDEALGLMKQKGTWFVPTIMAFEGVKERADKGTLPPQGVRKVQAVDAQRQVALRKAVALCLAGHPRHRAGAVRHEGGRGVPQ
jgi:imidazolonepropionase-like amidohydrolase